MSVVGLGTRSLLLSQSLVGMRAQLGDLQQQFATGKRADTYAGMGTGRGLAVGLRSHLSAIEAYNDTITITGMRIELSQTVLSRIGDIGRDAKASLSDVGSAEGRVTAQVQAMSSLGEALGLLNTQAGDRYLFSGLASDKPAVVSLTALMDGELGRAGFNQVVSERLQADLGAGGLGRLVIDQPAPGQIRISEDVAGSIFGFKLAGISSTFAGATTSGPAGAPTQADFDIGAANPNPGESLKVVFQLPDGSSETLTLTATTDPNAGPDTFLIGSDPTATAANLQAALTDRVGHLARTALTAASALAAADNFFNMDAANPPQRVDGPPFDSATGLRDATTADTVFWYSGEAGSQPSRSTATARIDQSINVSYGARANEEAIRWQLQNVAALAAISLPVTDADAEARASALALRLRPALDVPAGTQSVATIQAEMAGAHVSLKATAERHVQTSATVEDLIQGTEGISNEEVAAKILALQTALQASLQTTSRLFQISILNYL